jgi:cysteinyl-tRNA synthetase
VYDHLHIGHARMLFVFDVLHRYLKEKYKEVIFVQNITDIDDKIIEKAKKCGTEPKNIAEEYITHFIRECETLNLLPCIRPRVTDHLEEIFVYISRLIGRGKAYKTNSGIYLNTSSVPYNQFETKSNSQSRIEVAQDKLSEKDFALWKFREEWGFKSPWGLGIPGWHIECSAMSSHFLGESFHIHGGGIDLKFPHHENEIAQSFAMCDHGPAQIWMHNEMLNFMGEKMSKSIGNLKYIKDIITDHYNADLWRYYMLSVHYRNIMILSEKNLAETKKHFDYLRKMYFRNIFNKAIKTEEVKGWESDLDTPKLFQNLNKSIEQKRWGEMLWIVEICGFRMWPRSNLSHQEIKDFVNKRSALKSDRKYEEADEIRHLLYKNNVEIVDGEIQEWFYI